MSTDRVDPEVMEHFECMWSKKSPKNGNSWLDNKIVNVSTGDSLVPAETNIQAASKTHSEQLEETLE